MKTALLLLSMLFGLCACSRASERRAYAEQIAEAHAAADRASSAEELRAAGHGLERAFEQEPQGKTATTLPLRQDLADRIARLHLRLDEPAEALTWARRGLAENGDPTVLRGGLLITEADALEALGQRDEARTALMAALEINQTLLNVELENP